MLLFAANLINSIQRIKYTIHKPAASTAHQIDHFKMKCSARKTAAGINPSKFNSILKSKHSKKLPLRLVFLISTLRDDLFRS